LGIENTPGDVDVGDGVTVEQEIPALGVIEKRKEGDEDSESGHAENVNVLDVS